MPRPLRAFVDLNAPELASVRAFIEATMPDRGPRDAIFELLLLAVSTDSADATRVAARKAVDREVRSRVLDRVSDALRGLADEMAVEAAFARAEAGAATAAGGGYQP